MARTAPSRCGRPAPDPSIDVQGLLVTVNAAGGSRRDARGAAHAAGGAGGTSRPAAPRRRDPVAVPERRLRGAYGGRDRDGRAPRASSGWSSETCSCKTCASTGSATWPAPASHPCSRCGADRPTCWPATCSPGVCAPCSPASTRRCSPPEFSGRAFDEALLADLPADVDPCGEARRVPHVRVG